MGMGTEIPFPRQPWWTLHLSNDNPLAFYKIVIFDSGPTIERSLIVDQDLFVKAFYKQIPISQLSISDTRQIDSLLNEVDKFSHII